MSIPDSGPAVRRSPALVPVPAGGAATSPQRATYTVPEAAALLGVSPATIYVMLRQGIIPARRAGARWIIARKRFDEWLEGNDNALPGPAGAVG